MNDNAIFTTFLGVMNLVEYVLFNVFLFHYLEKRSKQTKMHLFIIVFVCVLTYCNLQRDLIKNIVTSFVLMFITALIIYRGNNYKKFAFTAIFLTISAISEVIMTFVISITVVTPLVVAVESFTTYIVAGFGGKLILFFIIFYLVKKYPQCYEFDRNRDIIMLSLFPTAALISAYVILEFEERLQFSYFLHILTIGFLIMYLFLSVSFFFYFP